MTSTTSCPLTVKEIKSRIRDFRQLDNNYWEPAGHYIVFLCNNEEESKNLGNQILQALELLELINNTKIDMTERERSLLDLLLKQSSETSGDKCNFNHGGSVGDNTLMSMGVQNL